MHINRRCVDNDNVGTCMNQKGQAAIEFIMLILIVLIYLLTITRPLVNDAKSLTNDVQIIVRADAEIKRIANSITEVSMLGKGTKKTILLFVPSNTTISCNEIKNSISFDLNVEKAINPPVGDCDDGRCCSGSTCTKTYVFPNKIDLTCTKNTMRGQTELIIINTDVSGGKADITLTG